MKVDFDPDTHTYRINGERVPSVTQVIKAILPSNYGPMSDEMREYAMQRGRAMHHACRLADESRLDWSTVDPAISGRVSAWQSFRNECPPHQVIANEMFCGHSVHRFAGTIDRVFQVENDDWIIDLKSTHVPQDFAQIGGYATLWEANGNPSRKVHGCIVELADDGSYRCYWMKPKEVEDAKRLFTSMLNVYRFARKHQLGNQ